LLLADLVFLPFGIFYLIKNWKVKESKFIFLWLLLAPLPAALSRDQVHAVRAYNMVIPFVVISALGVVTIAKRLRVTGCALVIFLIAGSLIYYLDSYFVHQPKHNSQYWEYGYKQAVEVAVANKDRYTKVHFRQSFAQPYIYYLFFTKYPPADYQKQAHLIESEYGDVGRVEQIDNIYFLPIDWTLNRGDSGTLFVADPVRIPPQDSNSEIEFEIVSEVKYLDGKSISQRVVGVK